MARGPVRAPYTASSAKPFAHKRNKTGKATVQAEDRPSKVKSATPASSRSIIQPQTDVDESYTYLPSLPKRHRTSEAQLSLSRDETSLAAGPSRRPKAANEDDDVDEDDMEERIRRVAMQIANDDPGVVETDESDVDSDLAWEEDGSDEERWGDVFRDLDKGKGKKGKAKAREVVKKPAKPLAVNLDESEDEQPSAKVKRADILKKGSVASTTKVADGAVESSENEDEERLEGLDEVDDVEDDEVNEFEEDGEFEGFGSTAGAVESGDEDEDEDDDEDAADEEEEDFEEDLRSFKPGQLASIIQQAGEESDEDEDDGDEDDDDDEDEDLELPSDLSEDEVTEEDLGAFVDELAAADENKRKVAFADDAEEEKGGKKRRVLPITSGPAVGDGEQTLKNTGKLDIATLLSSHPSLASARALLPSKSRKGADSSSKSILKSGVLPAPLPTIVQERIDREAAYEKTREEGQKWSGVMKRVREAEHLSFPLQNPGGVERGGMKSGGEMLSTFKPQNEMESAVQRLLDSANLTEKGMTQLEDQQLQGQDLTIEEIEARRADLRRQRELLFRAENRAKRVAKIKSKTFRKLARKRAEKEGLSLEDMERLEPGTMEPEREKLERERAKERATQRHSARNKFGRETVEGENTFGNEDRRKAREEMLDLKERLSRKIAGREEGESDSEDEDEVESGEEDEETIRKGAFDQLAQLDKRGGGEEEGEGGKKGLMQMKFMQKAREREMMRVKEAEEEAKRDIMLFGGGEAGDGEQGSEGDEDGDANMLKLGEGRMVFSGPAPVNGITRQAEETSPSPEEAVPMTSTSRPSGGNKRSALTAPRSPSPEMNPWLAAATASSASTSGPSRKRNTAAINTAADKATQSLKKARRKGAQQDDAVEDERVDIVLDDIPAATSAAVAGKRKARTEGKEEEDELLPTRPALFKQRDLVAEAFAGDDVVADFEKEKARQVEADAPKIEDTSLAGWGSWGGKGLKKRKPNSNSKFLIKTSGITPTSRKDFGQSNVIISERSEKKAKQFIPKDLPYPYTSVAQYQASLAMPVGSEWNSRTAVQRETMPRVIKKPGAIIEPVRRLF